MPAPQRGDVWLIDFGMAGKTRPALVVSVALGDQDRALITVVPHTTSLPCWSHSFESLASCVLVRYTS
jgi:mRNA-degrading endonuclease toxin of MazEF toxin-antitoxin module